MKLHARVSFSIKLAALATGGRAEQQTAACDKPFGRELMA
jgi:hypothetical protein